MLRNFIIPLTEKAFSPQVLTDILEYLVFNPFITSDEIKFTEYIERSLEYIVTNFFDEESARLESVKRELNKRIKQSEEFSSSVDKTQSSILLNELNESIKEIVFHLSKKRRALLFLLSVAKIRKQLILDRKEKYDELKQSPTDSKLTEYILEQLPQIAPNKPLPELDVHFNYPLFKLYEKLEQIKSGEFIFDTKLLDSYKEKISLYLNRFKSITNVKLLFQKYEQIIYSLEFSEIKSLKELDELLDRYITELKLTFESFESTRRAENSQFMIINKEQTDSQLTEFILSDYNIYKTLNVYVDGIIRGFEAGSTYLIGAPSNHGKSVFLIDTVRKFIEANLHRFEPTDAILYITLEDNRFKLSRRILSNFGVFNFEHIKHFYDSLKAISLFVKKYIPSEYKYTKDEINKIFSTLRTEVINRITKGKVNLVIRDATNKQDSYSVVDLIKDIEELKNRYGLKVRAVFIDYLNKMVSTKRYENIYLEHGQIMAELQSVALTYMVPVIVATQLKQEAEDLSVPLNPKLMGDSSNKTRYADYILMFRRTDGAGLTSQSAAPEESTQSKRKKVDVLSPIKYLSMLMAEQTYSQPVISDLITKILKNELEYPYYSIINYEKLLDIFEKQQLFSKINDSPAIFEDEEDDLDDEFDFYPSSEISGAPVYDDSEFSNTLIVKHQYLNKNDFEVLLDNLSIVQYSYTKTKDSGAPLTIYNYINKYAEKIEFLTKFSEDYKNLNINVNPVTKTLTVNQTTLNPAPLLEQYPYYMVFGKFSNRFYDLLDLPIIYTDLIKSVHNFKLLFQLIEGMKSTNKVKEVLKQNGIRVY